MRVLSLVLCALMLGAPAAAAEPEAGPQGVVREVQPPAWLKRGERAVAVRPGLVFRGGDELLTGAGGRLQADAPDGSDIELGAETRFRPAQFGARREGEAAVFAAILDLFAGSVRFRGDTRPGLRQEIRFQTPGFTVDTDGQDALLTAGPSGQRFLLLDGQARILTGAGDPISMDQPRSRISQDADGVISEVLPADAEMVGELRESVGLDPDRPVLVQGGGWQLVLFSVTNRGNAEARARDFIREGIPVALDEFQRDETTFHRLLVPDLRTRADAARMTDIVSALFPDLGQPWIKRADP